MVWKDSETLWSQVLKSIQRVDLALGNRENYRGKEWHIQEQCRILKLLFLMDVTKVMYMKAWEIVMDLSQCNSPQTRMNWCKNQ